MIDSHTHIYLPEFDKDRNEVILRAHESGITHLLMPAIDSSTHEAMLAAEDNFMNCHSMMGLHPCSVNDDYLNEIALVEGYLEKRRFIAVGEIGLDFYWDKTFVSQQYDAFHLQIALSLENDLPIVVHSRESTADCIGVVEQYPGLRGVFHCFSGTIDQATRLIDLGFFLGIGGVVTYKNAGLDKVVEVLGCSHLLLETDAPYLAPAPFRGKRNEPAYTRIIATRVAALCNKALEEVAAITSENAKILFRL